MRALIWDPATSDSGERAPAIIFNCDSAPSCATLSFLGPLETRSPTLPRPVRRLSIASCLRYATRPHPQGLFFLTWSVPARFRSTPSTRSPSCRSSPASPYMSASSGV